MLGKLVVLAVGDCGLVVELESQKYPVVDLEGDIMSLCIGSLLHILLSALEVLMECVHER